MNVRKIAKALAVSIFFISTCLVAQDRNPDRESRQRMRLLERDYVMDNFRTFSKEYQEIRNLYLAHGVKAKSARTCSRNITRFLFKRVKSAFRTCNSRLGNKKVGFSRGTDVLDCLESYKERNINRAKTHFEAACYPDFQPKY